MRSAFVIRPLREKARGFRSHGAVVLLQQKVTQVHTALCFSVYCLNRVPLFTYSTWEVEFSVRVLEPPQAIFTQLVLTGLQGLDQVKQCVKCCLLWINYCVLFLRIPQSIVLNSAV